MGDSNMAEILDKLYLGNELAVSRDELRELNITHILTINNRPLSVELHKNFQYLHIAAVDVEDADLLSRFEECFQFINEGRQSGGILVHCVAGVSRSATVVIGYVMHHTDHKLVVDAQSFVASKRPQIRPNSGFMEQLRLFEAIGSDVNKRHPHYINYNIKNLALRVQRGANVNDVLGELQSDPLHVGKNQSGKGTGNLSTFYKCRKCRRPLFRSCGVLSHAQGSGESAFHWKSQDATASPLNNLIGQDVWCQRSLFIEPVDWMKEDILELEGKLHCPKCSSKLGSYNWFGERCPCGSWVTPSFHIQTSKVDECRVRPIHSPKS